MDEAKSCHGKYLFVFADNFVGFFEDSEGSKELHFFVLRIHWISLDQTSVFLFKLVQKKKKKKKKVEEIFERR